MTPRPLADPRRRTLLVAGFLTFLLIGATQSLYGPAFDALQARYGVSASAVGLTVSLHFLGSFATILASGLLIRRFGYRRLLTAGAALMTLGLVAIALSPTWLLTLTAAFFVGLGFGVLDVGINLLFVRAFGDEGAPALNLLNALFGFGAVLGPALIAAFLPSIRGPFLIAAAVGLISTVLCARLDTPEPLRPQGPQLRISVSRTLGFVLLYFFYAGSEVAAASWETKHLTPFYGLNQAAIATSLYWGAITVGRLIATPISARVRPRSLVLGAAMLAFGAALLTHLPALAPYAYALMGLAFAPVFPTGLVWLQKTFPQRAEQITPLVVAMANLGPVVTAPLIGAAVTVGGTDTIPTAVSALVFMLLLTTVALHRRTRRD